MALTVGIDSFITLEQAEAYFTGRLYILDWSGAASGDKEKALKMAARTLNRLRWRGSLTSESQVMAWPRQGVIDPEGREITVTTIPQDIKDAQAEMALAMLREDLTADDSNRGVKRVKAGTVEVEYNGEAPAKSLPDAVQELLSPYLRPVISGSAALVF
ncbi:MAG: hypothetical protein HYU59_02340 [Magnetospirillum gryphiswaldense]|nr:hypothetical protein [Magnetospirillum gryphiswaldense]